MGMPGVVEDVCGGVPKLVKVAVRALSAQQLRARGKGTGPGRGGKELVHVWLHCQPPSQQAFCPACQKSHLCAYNKKVTRNVKRVDYEAEAFELDPVEGSDVPVEGSESEDSKEEIDG